LLCFAAATVVTPCAILAATLPGDGKSGYIDIGSFWLWHTDKGQPSIILHGTQVRIGLLIICAVLALLLAVTAGANHADHGLLFGGLTVFAAVTWIAAFLSVFSRRHVEDQAGRMFALLAALGVIVLVLAAYDWGRRQLMVGAVVVAVALSLFIVRVGFESLKVPPRWELAQIAVKATADEKALMLEYNQNLPALRATAKAALETLSDDVNGPPKPDVDVPVLTQAKMILRNAGMLIPHEESEDSNDFLLFDAQAADEPPSYPQAEITKLADAVHALQAAESAVESAAAAQTSRAVLDQAICVINPVCAGKNQITTNEDWVTDKHRLDVQLATYQAQVTGTQADQNALQAVLAQQPEVDADISVLAAIEDGPQALWRSAFHSYGPALVPGPLGWVLLGALLLWLLSWLLRTNARELAGPVIVAPVGSGSTGGATSDSNDQLTAELRVAVLQNVAEPGAAPGSPSINPVTTLLDIAGGPLSPISKLIQAVQNIAGQRYGYQVTIDVTSGELVGPGQVTGGTATTPAATASAGPARETSVLVRVISLITGLTCTSHVCTALDEREAVRTAGLWAAGEVLNRSSRIPLWAAWQAETAHALVTAKNRAEHTIPALEAALADAPNSGILLVLLGHYYELAGRRLDAIECYARAVTAYQRYSVARYRLAAALALMQYDRTWGRSVGQPDKDQKDGTLRTVESAASALGVDVGQSITELRKEGADPAEFKRLASVLLRALELDTRWWRLLAGALRRSERQSIWPALVPMSKHAAARFHPLVTSARRLLTDAGTDWRELGEAARKDGSWWQVSYNAACAHAAAIPGRAGVAAKEQEARTALQFLELTLVKPGVEQLSADWVRHDPDLAALRALPRFKWFLAQLRSGE